MYAKIVLIMDANGHQKTNDASNKRLNRVMDINKSYIEIGRSAFLMCVWPDYSKSLLTSVVIDTLKTEDQIVIWTIRSIYVLRKIELMVDD